MRLTQDKLADLLAKLPPLDPDGRVTGPDWADAMPVFDGLLELGKDGTAALVAQLREVDDGQDFRARYAIHGIALYLARPGKEAARAAFTESLAAQLGGDRPKSVQGYLARQLQVCGGVAQAPALGKLLRDEENCEYAAQALLAIRAGADEFRKALPEVAGRRRLTILQALGVLKDAASVEAFRKAASDPDRETRVVSAWALASIGDADSSDIVLKASEAEPGHERMKGVHSCLLLAENLAAAGKKEAAIRIYRQLRDSRKDPTEGYVKDLASQALAALGG